MDRPKTMNKSKNTSDIKFVYKRPLSATMSALSVQENKRQQLKKVLDGNDPLLHSLEHLKNSKSEHFCMQESEISKMLVRLDRITRNAMCGQKKIEISESEKIHVELFTGESQYAIVNTRGQTCPLNIIIKRHFGSLEIYVSRKIKEPSKLLNDEVHTKDVIKISDKSFFFVTPFVALNFTAVKDSSFSVGIVFGQKTLNQSLKKEWNSVPTLPKVSKTFMDEEIVKKKAPEKNFVKMNQTFVATKRGNFKSLEKKRHEVRERHRSLMMEVHEKKISYIKKNEIRLDAELKGMEIIEVIKRKENFEKFWLTFIMLGVSLMTIRKRVREKRIIKQKKILEKISARKIQRRFRQHLKECPIEENLLLMASDCLKYFFKMTWFVRRETNRKIAECIKKSAKNYQVPTIYSNFIRKVTMIQKYYREYDIVRNIRLDELNQTWVQTITKRLQKIHSYKKKSKKWKKREIEKYSSIDESVKKKIISDHLISAMKKYLESLGNFKGKVIEKMSVLQRFKFIESDSESVMALCPPIFNYIPSYRDMLALIDLIVGGNDEDG